MITGLALLTLFVLTALMVREAWLGYPPPSFAATILTRKEQAFLRASAEAFFPQGGALPSAEEAEVVRYFDRMLADLPGRQRLLIRLLFVLIEHGAIVFGPVHRRVTRQTLEERMQTFRGWERSPLYFRRTCFLSLRTLMTLAYFGDATVRGRLTPTGA